MDSKIIMLSVLTAFCCSETACAQRSVQTLKKNWQFSKGEVFNAKSAETVSVPHDWAIYYPFDRKNDLQVVAVEQNGEKEATEKTGRTGGLPFIGKGVYRTSFEVPDTAGKTVTLVFDGVMSNARVKLNGKDVASRTLRLQLFLLHCRRHSEAGQQPTGGFLREQGRSVTLVSGSGNLPQCACCHDRQGSYSNLGHLCHHTESVQ